MFRWEDGAFDRCDGEKVDRDARHCFHFAVAAAAYLASILFHSRFILQGLQLACFFLLRVKAQLAFASARKEVCLRLPFDESGFFARF